MTDRRDRQAAGGFAGRLRELLDAHVSANSLAKTLGRSEGAVRKWLRAESEPNVTDLRTICDVTGTSVEWLVTGRGRREAAPALQESAPPAYQNATGLALDHNLLEAVMEAVDDQIRRNAVELSATKRSMLVVTLYDLFQEHRKIDPDAVLRLVKLAR